MVPAGAVTSVGANTGPGARLITISMAPSGRDAASSKVELIATISGVAVAGGSVGAATVADAVDATVAVGALVTAPPVAGPGAAGMPPARPTNTADPKDQPSDQ